MIVYVIEDPATGQCWSRSADGKGHWGSVNKFFVMYGDQAKAQRDRDTANRKVQLRQAEVIRDATGGVSCKLLPV